MNIDDFAVEQWMNEWETKCTYNVAETCVDSLTLDGLLELTGADKAAFFQELGAQRLTYGHIEGSPEFLNGIAKLYRTVAPEHIVPTHGAAGANALALTTLVAPGDHVVAVTPTYQQLYSIPKMCGANVTELRLRAENGWHLDLDELAKLVTDDTKLVCINNPDNPTGALLGADELRGIVEIARAHDCWVLCDEVYRLLTQTDDYPESIIDLYDKGIAVASMSKVWSLAGLRLGWCVTKSSELRRALLSHRDYNLISCGLIDEKLAALALSHADALLARSRRIVRANLQVLDAWVRSEPRLSYVKPEAGTTALVRYDHDLDSHTFCANMVKTTGALVTPGDCFDEPKSMRIGYAYAEDPAGLQEGLDAISRYLHTLE